MFLLYIWILRMNSLNVSFEPSDVFYGFKAFLMPSALISSVKNFWAVVIFSQKELYYVLISYKVLDMCPLSLRKLLCLAFLNFTRVALKDCEPVLFKLCILFFMGTNSSSTGDFWFLLIIIPLTQIYLSYSM